MVVAVVCAAIAAFWLLPRSLVATGARPRVAQTSPAPQAGRLPRSSVEGSQTTIPPAQEAHHDEAGRPERGRLLVSIYDDEGRLEPGGWAESVACDLAVAPQDVPQRIVYTAPEGACTVRGARQDGLITTYGQDRQLVIRPGEDHRIDLIVPSVATGGMRLGFGHHEQGLVVRWAGAPEHDGLQVGDVVTTIDGIDAAGLPAEEVVEMLVGPVGSTVAVEVLSVDDTGLIELDLERRFLDPR